jgi:hypothetical protein
VCGRILDVRADWKRESCWVERRFVGVGRFVVVLHGGSSRMWGSR